MRLTSKVSRYALFCFLEISFRDKYISLLICYVQNKMPGSANTTGQLNL